MFSGNFDEQSVVKHYFRPTLELKIIRFYPKKWADGICMRFELYGCPVMEGGYEVVHITCEHKTRTAWLTKLTSR